MSLNLKPKYSIKVWQLLLIVLCMSAAAAALVTAVEAATGSNTIDNQKPFDYSNCQYPTRSTNPIDGCDNSDPCDPASAAKGGSGDCTPRCKE